MPAPFSVIFLGTSEFAVTSLKALLSDSAFTIPLVVTQPDRPQGRDQVIQPSPVKALAEAHGLTIIQPEKISLEILQQTKIPRPDFLVVVAYGQILSQEILDFPLVAPVNVHASLLPRWRGAAPIQHAILSGDTETGVTIQKMLLELDRGPILSQKKVPLDEHTTFQTLYDDLAVIGADLLVSTLKAPLQPTLQRGEGTLCRKLTREDGKVSPHTMTAQEIDRRVRALNPWPGVTCPLRELSVKLLETSLKPSPEALLLGCKDQTTLYIKSLQVPGKKPMDGKEWERGLR